MFRGPASRGPVIALLARPAHDDRPKRTPREPACMDLKCLNYFVTVIECGSFARASARLRIAQPALGWQIRKLEEELGAQLLLRHSRGVEPTDAGLRMLGHARVILARAQEAAAELRSLASEPQGTVVLGLTPSVNAMLTLPLLKRLSAEAPQIRMRPVEELSSGLPTAGSTLRSASRSAALPGSSGNRCWARRSTSSSAPSRARRRAAPSPSPKRHATNWCSR
jgi:hypothetical protein